VERAEAFKDAEAFVRELADHGIMLLSDQPISDPATTSKEQA
jgi:hypothetical protein